MAEEEIRVGLIGAGGNVRNRHIPGFRKVEGVQLLGVVNRSRESSHRVAEQFNIPRIYDHWQELLEDDALNAAAVAYGPNLARLRAIKTKYDPANFFRHNVNILPN